MEQKTIQQAKANEHTKPNLTGIPTQMKLDFEQRSGLSFDDVRVHYHSDKPARLQAMAYTQGTQVYIGPGQERHLPHELGHVVQQKLGLARPTVRYGKVPINNSKHMEQMADRFRTGKIPGMDNFGQTEDVLQYAGGIGVTLTPANDKDAVYGKDDLIVETIKFLDRPSTGKGRKQGAHSLALRFIQKYQQHMNKGKTLDDVLEFYDQFTSDILSDIEAASKKAITNMLSSCTTKEESEKALIEFRQQVKQVWSGSEIQAKNAKMMIDVARSCDELSMSVWSIYLGKTVEFANNAYAQGPLASQGEGSKGLGEGGGIGLLRELKRGESIDTSRMFANLIDTNSAGEINTQFDSVPIENREIIKAVLQRIGSIKNLLIEGISPVPGLAGEVERMKALDSERDLDPNHEEENNYIQSLQQNIKNSAIVNAINLVKLLQIGLNNNELGRVEARYVTYLYRLFGQYEQGMPESARLRSSIKLDYKAPDELLNVHDDNLCRDWDEDTKIFDLIEIPTAEFSYNLYCKYRDMLFALTSPDRDTDEDLKEMLYRVRNAYIKGLYNCVAKWKVFTSTHPFSELPMDVDYNIKPFFCFIDDNYRNEVCNQLFEIELEGDDPMEHDNPLELSAELREIVNNICIDYQNMIASVKEFYP